MRIGIDLGGTKIAGIALGANGQVLAQRRCATPKASYEETLRAVVEMVRALESQTGQRGTVGVGAPGALSTQTGLVKNANSTQLIGRPLDVDLGRCLGREVRLANDADCFALSEAVDGAASDANVVFGVILGTGVGGGVVIDRQLLRGANAISGEWGHNPMPWPKAEEIPGPPCYCGKSGCIETFLSGIGFAREFNRVTGRNIDARTIAAEASSGGTDAGLALAVYSERLARGLASVMNILDLHVIVLGGGVSAIEELYELVPLVWSQFVFSDHISTRLVAPKHGDASGVRGAAWLWPMT